MQEHSTRKPRRRRPLDERLWEKILVAGPDECHEWQAATDHHGYGHLGRGSREEGHVKAHRLVYELTQGPIPEDQVVRHTCDNSLCCNPRHLILGSHADNMRDKVLRGRWRLPEPVYERPIPSKWTPPDTSVECICRGCGITFTVTQGEFTRGRGQYCKHPCYLAHKAQPFEERLWNSIDQTGDCWIFTGCRNRKGYGVLPGHAPEFRQQLAHRAIWELLHGAIPKGLHILHSCDNPPCCNPDHLRCGTNAENRQDSVNKGRQAKGDRSPRRLHPDNYASGTAHHNAKLNPEKVREIRARYTAGGASFKTLGVIYGVSSGVIDRIVHRETWKHVE